MKRNLLTIFIVCLLLISVIRMADGFPKRILTTLGIYRGNDVAYSPDGRLLALLDGNLIFLLDAETLTQIGTLIQSSIPSGFYDSINTMAFSPDAQWLAAGNRGGFITIWNLRKMTEKLAIQAYEQRVGDISSRGDVIDLDFHPDNKTLASVGDYGIIKFWDIATGKEIRSFKDISIIDFDPTGEFLVSAGSIDHETTVQPETTVQIRNPESGQLLFALPVREPIFDVAFTPNPDEQVIAFNIYSSARLITKLWKDWQLQNQVITLETEGDTRHPIFTPDGRTLITAGDAIRFWDVETGNFTGIFPNSESRVIALHPDGNRLAALSEVGTLKILNTGAGELINEFDKSNVIYDVLNISFSADEKRLIAISRQRLIQQWELATGKNPFSRVLDSPSPLYYSVFSPDERQFAAMSDKIYIWDATTGEQLQTIDHRGGLLAYGVDGILATSNLEGDIQLLDALTGEPRHTLQANAEKISALAFSPDGRLLASGNSDGVIQLWDVRTGAMLRAIKGHEGKKRRYPEGAGVLALAFSPDGRLLASGGGSHDYKVRLWDVATGAPLHILEEHTSNVVCLDFSPDGKLLASGSDSEGWNDSVNIWDVATGKLRHTFRLGSWRVRFSPSGKQLAFVIAGHILVWNLEELLSDTTPVTPKGLKSISWGELRVSPALLLNYPNPANPETWIPYQLLQPAPVVIRIYNQKGQVVRTLSLGEKNAGFYFTKDKAAYWDGKDSEGEKVASGIYFYTLEAGEFRTTRKMVIIR
jgi:WD40 repeat protein